MSIKNRATKRKSGSFMLNQIEKGIRLSHEVIKLASSLLWEKETLPTFEDTGLEWNQFSQRRGKNFGQVLFIKEKEHWIFVYRKGGVNICDSLRNNGKQDYLEKTVRAICRITWTDLPLKINSFQVQHQSSSIDCGDFNCHQMKAVMIEMCNHLSTCLQL